MKNLIVMMLFSTFVIAGCSKDEEGGDGGNNNNGYNNQQPYYAMDNNNRCVDRNNNNREVDQRFCNGSNTGYNQNQQSMGSCNGLYLPVNVHNDGRHYQGATDYLTAGTTAIPMVRCGITPGSLPQTFGGYQGVYQPQGVHCGGRRMFEISTQRVVNCK